MQITEPTKEFQVLLFYVYKTIDDPYALATRFREWCKELTLTGRIIVAEEGVNATVEGMLQDTELFAEQFCADARFNDVSIKRSWGSGESFLGISIKVRKEIVGTGFTREEADPRISTAPKLSAEDLRDWYDNERDFVVVDMRNNYEFASGHFKDSVEPGISASRHLPLAIDKLLPLKEKTIVTVCTGGIRCEKMSAYLIHKGFKDVHQLDGGIHTYMEKFPGKDFSGTLYTFDNRLTMDFGGAREIIGVCKLCDSPSEIYINCANQTCHLHFIACERCISPEGTYCSSTCKA
jgi:UPF0176 protein